MYRISRYCDELVEDGTSLTVTKGAEAATNLTGVVLEHILEAMAVQLEMLLHIMALLLLQIQTQHQRDLFMGRSLDLLVIFTYQKLRKFTKY